VQDFQSFESLFTKEIMEAVEFVLYDYMTEYHAVHKEFMELVHEVLGGTNKCFYRNFMVLLKATRMSGEMCTSLGNGFANLMFFLFLAQEVGFKNAEIGVEGDDSLATGHGTPPSPADYAKLGLVIKQEVYTDLAEASFCGIIFDPHDKINVTDPREVLATFGWTTRRYARSKKSKLMALLRCKALSLAHQYPGCPIIAALARYGLRVTRSYDVRSIVESRHFSWWERGQLREALRDEAKLRHITPPSRTRLLVESKFGITVETQLRWEAILDNLNDVVPLVLPGLTDHCPAEWASYYVDYSTRKHRLDPKLEWPRTLVPVINSDRLLVKGEVRKRLVPGSSARFPAPW